MNPPFTRQERLPFKYKKSLEKRLKEYCDFMHGQLGLYGYFVFLADKFVKRSGRIALVLPATILRLRSTEGVRRLILDKYHIEYIITTIQRAAFSESAQFREILLIGRKLSNEVSKDISIRKNNCVIVILNELPSSHKDLTNLISKISDAPKLVDSEGIYSDDMISLRIVPHSELEENMKNLFSFIAFNDPKVSKKWIEIRKSSKLIPLNNYLHRVGGEIIRGIEILSGKPISVPTTFIIRKRERAVKKGDIWIISNLGENYIVAENKVTQERIEIPLNAIRRGLRRLSGIRKLDISDIEDFIVVKQFPTMDRFFKEMLPASVEIKKWKYYIESRAANLLVNWRFDISASGTHLLAFYSEEPVTPTKMMWSIKGLHLDDAKILSLWFNSTLNIIQILAERVETRGAFLEIFQYILKNFMILDPYTLSRREKEILLNIFNEIKDIEFPSIMTQLKTAFPIRRKIDEAILKVIGFSKEEIEDLLNYLYPTLYKEILRLKELMAG